jgi:hypothetical protein
MSVGDSGSGIPSFKPRRAALPLLFFEFAACYLPTTTTTTMRLFLLYSILLLPFTFLSALAQVRYNI